MRHFCFECVEGEHEGEQFLVGEEMYFVKAFDTAMRIFGKVEYICEMTEYDAEQSGLDEW